MDRQRTSDAPLLQHHEQMSNSAPIWQRQHLHPCHDILLAGMARVAERSKIRWETGEKASCYRQTIRSRFVLMKCGYSREMKCFSAADGYLSNAIILRLAAYLDGLKQLSWVHISHAVICRCSRSELWM